MKKKKKKKKQKKRRSNFLVYLANFDSSVEFWISKSHTNSRCYNCSNFITFFHFYKKTKIINIYKFIVATHSHK